MIKRNESESIKDYKVRLFRNKEQYGITFQDIADLINDVTGNDYSESAYRKWASSYIEGWEDGYSRGLFEQYGSAIEELEKKKNEIVREKIKNRTLLMDLNKQEKIAARDELIMECIIDEIKNIKPLEIPEYIEPTTGDREGILIIADQHAGIEFTIRGLEGEIINSYNWNVFENRMWQVYNRILQIIKKEEFKQIRIFDLGDNITGLLRISQIQLLQKGVVKSTIDYAKFMSIWLNELSKHVNIIYASTKGNHDELRLLSPEKGVFPEENVNLIIKEFLQIRLENNPNITIINNPSDNIFVNVCGYNILGIHGETKDPIKYLKDATLAYKKRIDYLIAGHMHHLNVEAVARDSEAIIVPSIIGIDEYAMKLLKTSDPGVLFTIFEKGGVCRIDYKIKLN